MAYTFSVIGYPIQHSLSPWIHEQFLNRTNTEGEYTIHEITPEMDFDEEVRKLMAKNPDGFNVTVPYKERIMKHLDLLDDTARDMGAVNTVIYQNGEWTGYNTDGIGYYRALTGKFPELLEKRDINILILGSGGAARGIYFALDRQGFRRIDIANRTKKNAEEMSQNAVNTTTSVLTLEEAEQQLGDYQLIIQTSSVGMKPVTDKQIIQLDQLQKETIVSDIVYQPIETQFIRTAAQKGARIHYGHTMLLYQGQQAFEIWTDKKVPMDGLDDELSQILKGRL